MKTFLLFTQVLVALLLAGAILIQSKGTGFGRVWGSSNVSFTRRGLEQLVFKSTFVLAAVFILVSILQLVI